MPRLTKRERTIRVVIPAVIAAVLVVTAVWVTEVELTRQEVLLHVGNYTGGYYDERNTSFQFHLDRPGLVTGSWNTSLDLLPPSTAYLYHSSQCHALF